MKNLMLSTSAVVLGVMMSSCGGRPMELEEENMKSFDFAVFEEKTLSIELQNDLGEPVKAPVYVMDRGQLIGYGVTDDRGHYLAPISWHAGMEVDVIVGGREKVDVADIDVPQLLTYSPDHTASFKTESTDTDGDGVVDSLDIDPDDARFASYASSTGRFLFEDLYPYQGDYDFNDVVVDYQVSGLLDAAGNLRKAVFIFTPKHSGAGDPSKLNFELAEITKSDISNDSSSTDFDQSVSANSWSSKWELATNFGDLDNGVSREYSDTVRYETFAMIEVPYYGSGKQWEATSMWVPSDLYEVVFDYVTTGYGMWSLDSTHNNMTSGIMTVGFELPVGYTMADVSANKLGVFITNRAGKDVHSKPLNESYADETGMPFGLHVPQEVRWPAENERIDTVYPNFNAWATSNGTMNQDWWK